MQLAPFVKPSHSFGISGFISLTLHVWTCMEYSALTLGTTLYVCKYASPISRVWVWKCCCFDLRATTTTPGLYRCDVTLVFLGVPGWIGELDVVRFGASATSYVQHTCDHCSWSMLEVRVHGIPVIFVGNRYSNVLYCT